MSDENQSTYEGVFDAAAVVRHALDETYVIDTRTARFLYANDVALQNTGYSLDEITSMTPMDLQKDAEVATMAGRLEPLRRGTERAVTFETTYHRKDGGTYNVEHRVQLLESHDPPVFVVRARPIAERHLPESALVSDAGLYRQMVEDSSNGVWAADAQGVTVFVNDTMCAMLGYAREEMVGVPIFDFVDEQRKGVLQERFAARRRGIGERHDALLVRKDGSELWVIIAARPLSDGDGEFSGVVAIITDITERKLREHALLETLHVTSADELWGGGPPSPDVPVVRMPGVLGVRADRVAKRFSILADPKRLELIELLASGEDRTVTALAAELRMTPSNVSKHLKILLEAGLVSRRQDAARTIYSLTDPTVAVLCRIVCHWLGNQAQAEIRALAS